MRVALLFLIACSGTTTPKDPYAAADCDSSWNTNGFTDCEAGCTDSAQVLGAKGSACQALARDGLGILVHRDLRVRQRGRLLRVGQAAPISSPNVSDLDERLASRTSRRDAVGGSGGGDERAHARRLAAREPATEVASNRPGDCPEIASTRGYAAAELADCARLAFAARVASRLLRDST